MINWFISLEKVNKSLANSGNENDYEMIIHKNI